MKVFSSSEYWYPVSSWPQEGWPQLSLDDYFEFADSDSCPECGEKVENTLCCRHCGYRQE